ncbi:MAG: hypothetical protein RLZZ524_1394, partial [Pseudomonadota bacterium]
RDTSMTFPEIGRIERYVLARMREASTWRGLVYLLTACGLAIDSEQVAAITSFGLALAGLIGTFVADVPPPSGGA